MTNFLRKFTKQITEIFTSHDNSRSVGKFLFSLIIYLLKKICIYFNVWVPSPCVLRAKPPW